MDVRLSPEQRALRDSVRQVLARLGPKTVGDLDDRERAAKLDAAVDAAGWRELRCAADSEAPWASGVEAGIVAEELARGAADTAFLGPTLAAELRRLAGAPAAGARETVALDTDLGAPGTALAVDAGGSVEALGMRDGQLLTLALGDGGGADLTRPVALTGAPGAPVAGPVGHEHLVAWTALALALTSAELVGTMSGAVALAVDYAKERRQYGSAIGSFQAVQHLLADAHVLTEGSRSAALHAAWAVDALAPAEAVRAGAVAKAYASRAARTVCETVIQVHGGIGNTWECLAHVHLRRALLSTDVAGGVGPNLGRVVDGLR